MPETIITFIKGDKLGSETDYRDALPVNMSGVIRPLFGADGYMLQQPGLTKYGTAIGIDRGGVWNERFQEHYRVSGNSFIKVGTDGSVTTIGAAAGTDLASMPYSFNTQAVLVNGTVWLYDKTAGTFTQITDPNIGTPLDMAWIDNYYIFTDGDYLYHTNAGSETAINALNYATAEFMPDKTLGVGRTASNMFRAFGRYHIEDFVDEANADFAFTRLNGRAIPKGIVATHAKCQVAEDWFIVGGGLKESISVYKLGVGTAQNIASREVMKIIAAYTEPQLANIHIESRSNDGYSYVIVHLPNETLLFNLQIAEKFGIEYAWSKLKTDVLGTTPWRGTFGIFEPNLGKWVYGDTQSSSIAYLDDTVTTHFGTLAEWELYTPLLDLETMSIDELNIETIPGFTSDVGAGVFVSLTYDGITYGSEMTQPYGEPSAYGTKFIIYQLGYVPDKVGIKLRGASPSRMAFSRAKIAYG